MEKRYGLPTAICMVVGTVIGSGVFFKAQTVLEKTGGNMTLGEMTLFSSYAGLIYGPETVIVIAGKNKIVGSLDEAYERTRRDCCPGNARRQGFKTPCALVGECNDCRSADRMCRVVTIHEMPTRRVKAFHILIVDQDLGL